MKKLLFIIAFAASVLVAASCNRQGDNSLKVISYNIRLGVADDGENNWENRKPASIAMLKEENPDVFGLQEAYGFQTRYLADNLPSYKWVGVGREDGDTLGEIMAVYYDTTRVSLIDWGTYWLSETPDVPSFGWGAACRRTATWTKMRHNSTGKEFFYVNTHLDHVSSDARRNGLALIVEEIAEMNPDGDPMILTGDFNIPPTSDNLVELDKIMTSARTGAEQTDSKGSFNGWGKYGRSGAAPTWDGPVEDSLLPIDYIYYSGFSRCLYFKVLDKEYVGVKYISDHYPIVSELIF